MTDELQKVRSPLSVYLIAGNSVLGCFYFGYALGYLNVSQETVNTVFDVPENGLAWIDGLLTALLPIGAAIGALMAGPMLGAVSRQQSMIITDIIAIIGIMSGILVNLYTLFFSRLIIGVAVGLNSTIVPLYIKEYTPISLRGTVGSMNQVSVNSGIFIAFLMGLGYPDATDPNSKPPYNNNDYWRIVFLLPIIFCVSRTLFLLTVFRDDPPGYYVSKLDIEKAQGVLGKIYKQEHVQEQLIELERDERQKSSNSQNYSDLVGPLYLRRLVVGCLLCSLQQLCGINSVIFYSTAIFGEITKNQKTINILNLAVGVTNIVFALVAGVLMKKFGRKYLLLFGDLLCGLSLMALAIFSYLLSEQSQNAKNSTYQTLVVGLIFIYLVGFQLSLGPITWIYLAEILPEKGLSIAVLVNWVCVSIVAQIFPILQDSAGISVCFLMFSIVCFLGLFFVGFMVQETKGKSAVSIDNMYYSMVQNQLLDTSPSSSSKNGKTQ